MGLKDFLKDGAGNLVVARPDEHKSDVVYKHPDQTIPDEARLTVDADEVALFFRDGEFVGQFEAGRHVLDSDNIPFLSQLVDRVTDGELFQAELYFVTTREFTGLKFGGPVGKLRDPESGLAIEMMVHGSFSLRVDEPRTLIGDMTGLSGSGEDDDFTAWFKEQVLKTIRDDLAELVVKRDWPLLDVTSGAYTEEIEETVLAGVGDHCEDYGIEIVRLGNFNVAIDRDDEERLEELYDKAAHVDLAGGMEGYEQMAKADMMRNAGEGGGDSSLTEGACLGAGMAMGREMADGGSDDRNTSSSEPSPSGGGPRFETTICSSCESEVVDGNYCFACGDELQSVAYCPSCGTEASSGNYCIECGTELDA